jgi:hypothetical protein
MGANRGGTVPLVASAVQAFPPGQGAVTLSLKKAIDVTMKKMISLAIAATNNTSIRMYAGICPPIRS